MYNATDDRYHNNANWTGWGNSTSTSDPCTDNWYGITCIEEDSVQYVSEIDLLAHELFGLSEEIIEMKHLKTLLLTRNVITEYLDISANYLNITLPMKMQLPHLKHHFILLMLYFPQNWKTPKLEDLVLNNNDLMGYLPDDLGERTIVASRQSLN